MDIAVETPEFHGRKLAVRPASVFRGSRLVVNGELVKGRFGRYIVRDNQGKEVIIRLISNYIDPIPKIKIADQVSLLARPLHWYKYIWCGLPILLVFEGGAIGAICGFVALQRNAAIFRGSGGNLKKYLVTLLISLSAVGAYILLASLIFIIFKQQNI